MLRRGMKLSLLDTGSILDKTYPSIWNKRGISRRLKSAQISQRTDQALQSTFNFPGDKSAEHNPTLFK